MSKYSFKRLVTDYVIAKYRDINLMTCPWEAILDGKIFNIETFNRSSN
jgi:hypothetical protein